MAYKGQRSQPGRGWPGKSDERKARSKRLRRRSKVAVDAALRVGGPMKDRRTPRGGSKPTTRQYLEDGE